MSTAVSASVGSLSRLLSRLVLPAPRKPVSTVSGSGGPGRRGSRAFSGKVCTGFPSENATKQKCRDGLVRRGGRRLLRGRDRRRRAEQMGARRHGGRRSGRGRRRGGGRCCCGGGRRGRLAGFARRRG